jgi:hypothetical protein
MKTGGIVHFFGEIAALYRVKIKLIYATCLLQNE